MADSRQHEGTPRRTLALHAITGMGKVIGGQLFKPDASAAPAGARCARCGATEGVAWIAGAGEHLCAQHQDEY
jgi:hypothetical protein